MQRLTRSVGETSSPTSYRRRPVFHLSFLARQPPHSNHQGLSRKRSHLQLEADARRHLYVYVCVALELVGRYLRVASLRHIIRCRMIKVVVLPLQCFGTSRNRAGITAHTLQRGTGHSAVCGDYRLYPYHGRRLRDMSPSSQSVTTSEWHGERVRMRIRTHRDAKRRITV